MKIYIVSSGEYSDYSINSVFTDKAKAEACVEIRNRASNYSVYGIEEWDADQTLPFEAYSVRFSPKLIATGKRKFASYVGESQLERVPGVTVVEALPEAIVHKVRLADGSEIFMGTAFGLTYEKAEKSFWDALAKAKAEDAGL